MIPRRARRPDPVWPSDLGHRDPEVDPAPRRTREGSSQSGSDAPATTPLRVDDRHYCEAHRIVSSWGARTNRYKPPTVACMERCERPDWELSLSCCFAVASVAAAQGPRVLELRLGRGGRPVRILLSHLGDRRCGRRRVLLDLLDIDTPGGLDSAMRDIVTTRSELGCRSSATCRRPGRARVAGTFILTACHVAAMAPGNGSRRRPTPSHLGRDPAGTGDERRRASSEPCRAARSQPRGAEDAVRESSSASPRGPRAERHRPSRGQRLRAPHHGRRRGRRDPHRERDARHRDATLETRTLGPIASNPPRAADARPRLHPLIHRIGLIVHRVITPVADRARDPRRPSLVGRSRFRDAGGSARRLILLLSWSSVFAVG